MHQLYVRNPKLYDINPKLHVRNPKLHDINPKLHVSSGINV